MWNHWHSIDLHFELLVAMLSIAILPRKEANTSNLEGLDNSAFWLPKVKDKKFLTLCWPALSNYPNSYCMLNNCMPKLQLSLVTTNISVRFITICIQQLCTLTISYLAQFTLSEWWMTQSNNILWLQQQNVNRSGSHTQISQTLQ